jgi:hypothetical protein
MKRTVLVFVCLASVMLVRNSFCAEERFKGPPHGGTPVQVGNHGFHLELVRDAEKGRFQAYVLDAHVQRYVPVPERSFEMVATISNKQERVTFNRTAPAGAAKAPDASYEFEAAAEWIKTATNFNAVLPKITLKGRTFTNVTFAFPKGSMHRAH